MSCYGSNILFSAMLVYVCREWLGIYNRNLRKNKDLAKEDLTEGRGVLCSRTEDRGIRTYLKVVHS